MIDGRSFLPVLPVLPVLVVGPSRQLRPYYVVCSALALCRALLSLRSSWFLGFLAPGPFPTKKTLRLPFAWSSELCELVRGLNLEHWHSKARRFTCDLVFWTVGGTRRVGVAKTFWFDSRARWASRGVLNQLLELTLLKEININLVLA